MIPVKRPSSKDTEEDLLKLQDEFLKEKSKPAAGIESKRHMTKERISVETSNNSNEKIADEIDISSKCVMFDIRERNIVSPTISLPRKKAESFPLVSKRNTDMKNVKRNKSIFAQQMEKMKTKNQKTPSVSTPAVKLFDSPIIIDGSGLGNVSAEMEVKNIHEENLTKLSALTQEEILVERKLLLEKMDPKLIDFIQKKKKSKLVKDLSNHGSVEASFSKEDKSTRCLPGNHAHQTCKSSFSMCRSFPPSSSASVNESPEEIKILKMSKGYDRDGIILESMPEGIISDAQTEIDTADVNDKNCVELNTTNDTELNEEELPINPKDTSKWLHMDKIEKQKLEWMTMLPKPKPIDLKSGYTARFDFEGKLLSHDGDIPTQKGLHHHSDQPELPGYTVEELFLLARSSAQSQRVMALKTLAHVVENNWQGMFDGCFEESLLIHLLNAGIAPLLRWALDDTTDSSIAAAVMAIHHLLVCSTDELCLDMTFSWANGHLSPFIKPYDVEEVPEENLKELTDANIIKLDVIKGFLRMDILPRLRYILVVTCPPFPVCQLIIEMLIRFARHSYESAKMVVECPFLLETIFMKFLPTSWNIISNDDETKKTNDFVCPVPCALKLMRVISSSNIQLAVDLVTNHRLDSSLSYYLSLGLSDVKLSAVDVQKLMVETLRTWRVLLAYGLCSDIYIDLFPVLLRQLQYFITISISIDSGVHAADYTYASVFFKALEAVVTVAADHNMLSSPRSNSSLPIPSVMWHHVTGLLPMVENCLQKWLYEFSHNGVTTAGSVLLASCIDFFNIYCTKAKEQLDLDSPKMKKKIQNVITGYLLPCLQSVSFASSLDNLWSYSVLLYSGISGSKRSTNTLASLGSILWKDDIVPILKEGSPFPLTTSVVGLLTVLIRLLPSFDEKIAKIILLHPSVVKYIKQVAAIHAHFNHWFDRIEVAFLYRLTELASLEVCGDPTMWHNFALSLLSNIRISDEWIIKYLMENIIFNDAVLLYSVDTSPTLIHEEMKTGKGDIRSYCCQNYASKEKLLSISQVYIDFFLSASSLNRSRQKWLKSTYDWPTSVEDDLKSIVPRNWPYKPLLMLYQQSKTGQTLSPELTTEVTAFLEWIYLSQQLQLPAFKHISPLIVFCHLCLVYILGSDVFYDMRIKDILHACLCHLVKQGKLDGLENIQWNDTTKYDDLFSDLVVQFEAESYGDHVFANYLLVAFQQCYPSSWKKIVFAEHPQAVRIIGIPLSKLIVPLMNFLEPKETDTVLLTLYFKGLSSGLLKPERSPLLYLMAVHHLHHYIFVTFEEPTKFQKTLLNSVLRCREKEVIYHILLYKNPAENGNLGFEVAECFTSEDEVHLCNLYGKPVIL